MCATKMTDDHSDSAVVSTREKTRPLRSHTLSLLLLALLVITVIAVIVRVEMMHRRLAEVEESQSRVLKYCKRAQENAENESSARERERRSSSAHVQKVLTIQDVQAEIKRSFISVTLSQFCEQGITGPPGPPGPQGMPGKRGAPGESIAVPEILVSPDSLTVLESQTASYACSGTGNPRPTLKWSKNEGQISNDRIKTTSQGELKVFGSQYDDSGDYTCQAENILGKANATVHLNVEVAPKFTKKPVSVISIPEGKTGTLLCEVFGNPPPKIKWTKPFMALPAGRSEVRGGRLRFRDFKLEDSGLYACEATNKLGSILALVTVNFIKKRFIKVELKSGGYEDKVIAMSIKVDGVELSPVVRGHSIVALNRNGKLHSRATFDTYADSSASRKMTSFVNLIPVGSIVLVVTRDSAESYYNAAALKSVGAQDPLDEGRRGSWYLVGYKGKRQPWVQQGSKPRRKGPIGTTVFIPVS